MNPSRWARALIVLVVLGFIGGPASVRADAGPSPAVIAVVTRADWCSVCKTHGARAGKVIMAAGGGLRIVINDVTSDTTRAAGAAALAAAGLTRAMAPYTTTGVIHLFDAATKRRLGQVSIAAADPAIAAAIAGARQAARRK